MVPHLALRASARDLPGRLAGGLEAMGPFRAEQLLDGSWPGPGHWLGQQPLDRRPRSARRLYPGGPGADTGAALLAGLEILAAQRSRTGLRPLPNPWRRGSERRAARH